MKGTKTSLFLVELIISLLLFSFCAAICIQIFNAASKRARDSEALNRAVFLVTQAAELYKASGGDLKKVHEEYGIIHSSLWGVELVVYYDENWNETMNPMFSSSSRPYISNRLTLSETSAGEATVTVQEPEKRYYDYEPGEPLVWGKKIAVKTIFSIDVKAVA
jgi:type II secretory pathway pseudopilin PulG